MLHPMASPFRSVPGQFFPAKRAIYLVVPIGITPKNNDRSRVGLRKVVPAFGFSPKRARAKAGMAALVRVLSRPAPLQGRGIQFAAQLVHYKFSPIPYPAAAMSDPAALGIDIGGTKTLCLLVNNKLQVLKCIKFKTAPEKGVSRFRKKLLESAKALKLVAQ